MAYATVFPLLRAAPSDITTADSLRTEIIESQKALGDYLKWKLIAVAAIAVVAFGLDGTKAGSAPETNSSATASVTLPANTPGSATASATVPVNTPGAANASATAPVNTTGAATASATLPVNTTGAATASVILPANTTGSAAGTKGFSFSIANPLLICLIPFVCLYIDLLSSNRLVQAYTISRHLRARWDPYELSVMESRELLQGGFSYDRWVLYHSSTFFAILILLCSASLCFSSKESIWFLLALAGLVGFVSSVLCRYCLDRDRDRLRNPTSPPDKTTLWQRCGKAISDNGGWFSFSVALAVLVGGVWLAGWYWKTSLGQWWPYALLALMAALLLCIWYGLSTIFKIAETNQNASGGSGTTRP